VGLYEDHTPGEIFITMAKEGSVVSGLVDSVATLTSISLQYGVPLEVLCNKFIHTRFEPSGFTNNPQIPMAKSILDYIFRWMQMKFVRAKEAAESAPADMPSTGLDTAMDVKASSPSAAVKLGSPAMGTVKLAGKTQVSFQVESVAQACFVPRVIACITCDSRFASSHALLVATETPCASIRNTTYSASLSGSATEIMCGSVCWEVPCTTTSGCAA
jgi:ribonucleoside-diphosphate reductase alpha chain